MYGRQWTPPPEHWGGAAQRGLAHLGASLVDNDRDRKRREREAMLDAKADEQWKTGLKMTPGVTEIAPETPTHSTRGSVIDPSNPGQPLQQVNLPGISGALQTPRGQTRLTDTLAFNPNHEQDRADQVRTRKIESATQALIAEGEDPQRARSRAVAIADGLDTSYRGPSTQEGFIEQQQDLTKISEDSQVRVGQAPRWTPPPPPPTQQLITTDQGYEWATPGEPVRGRPLPPRGGQEFASQQLAMKDAMEMAQQEADRLGIDARPDELYAGARRLQRGQPAFDAPPERGSSAAPYELAPMQAQPRSSGFGEVALPPRRSAPSGQGVQAPPSAARPSQPSSMAPGPEAPTGTRNPAVLDQAVQFYAPLPADQREAAMREDGASDEEIQYMLSKIGG